MRQNQVTAFTGGRILSMDPKHRTPAMVVINNGRIVGVGDREILRSWPTAQVHDLGGKSLMPGFIDAHNHLSIVALHPRWRDLSHVTSVEELLNELKAQASEEPDAPWIRCRGWNELTTGITPTRKDLDSLGLGRPIILAHYTLHQALVCSRALDLLGIGKTTPDPGGGEIERDETGQATGILLERAWSQAHAKSLVGYDDPDLWSTHLAARARVLLAEGITAVHDAACSPAAESLYAQMAAAGTLPLSVLAMPHPEALLMSDIGSRFDGPRTGEGDEWLRVGAVKLFADGGQSPAIDVHIDGNSIQLGIVMEDIEAAVLKCTERGFRVAVHAMGNVGVQRSIEAFAAAGRARKDEDHRFRIEHVGVASRSQVNALAELGAVACVQPGFVDHVGTSSGGVTFDDHKWLPFADLRDAGIPLAASSDDPCAGFEPLWGAGKATTRMSSSGVVLHADQAVPFEEWLEAYTIGAAFSGGQEHERGSLTVGKRADLVIVDGDLGPDPLPRVSETWVAGEQVFVR